MNVTGLRKHFKKIFSIIIAVILLFAAIYLWVGSKNSLQSKDPMIAGVSFKGEYRIGDEAFKPYVKGEHIPANRGDVTLRGIFLMHNPETGEAVRPVSIGNMINLYFNHIGGTFILPSGEKLFFDAENERLGEDACAAMWGVVPATGDASITITLHNPHKYGNIDAVDEFFEHMSIAPGSYFENMMLEKGAPERTIGDIMLIISIIILGIAVFSSIIHIQYSMSFWLIGLMSFFAGGYFLFGSFAVSLWSRPNIFNTRIFGLCMMFYMFFCALFIVMQLNGRLKNVGTIAVSISAISILICITISLLGYVKFYDTWIFWIAVEAVVAVALTVCLILCFKKSANTNNFLSLVGLSTLFAFVLDSVAAILGWWSNSFLSKTALLAELIISLVVVLRVIPSYINAASKARELEAEKQTLELEIQESRISIMLSQMQPHFIFNTLNTIYHLCEFDPKLARSTIDSFSTYLRNNIDNLDRHEMIHFDKEFSFVKAYLDIEKVRFDDELQITLDLPVTNFKLPVLSMQPIVENAVKHGTSKKKGCSTLSIFTRETDTYYEIEIRDTGVGFDTSTLPSDEHKHIGISNVRQRLKQLCDGTLTIESEIGQGTTAIIRIPKKGEQTT